MDITKYKTKLCTYYLSGYCKYGENCFFAHGYDDLSTGKSLFSWNISKINNFTKIWAIADSISEARKIILDRIKEFVLNNNMPTKMCSHYTEISRPSLIHIINTITYTDPDISQPFDCGIF